MRTKMFIMSLPVPSVQSALYVIVEALYTFVYNHQRVFMSENVFFLMFFSL